MAVSTALGALDGPEPSESVSIALAVETVAITKKIRRTLVRASVTTHDRDQSVAADLTHEQVVVERIPIGRIVDAVPPVRQEGDVTIMPVVEEELVVVRRLVLKEEVRLRRVRTTVPHTENVTLRRQTVSVTRTPLDD